MVTDALHAGPPGEHAEPATDMGCCLSSCARKWHCNARATLAHPSSGMPWRATHVSHRQTDRGYIVTHTHPPTQPPQPQQVVLLQEPKADASPAPTDAARRALFSLSSMVLHWGPAPSGGHYTCATRVHGAVPWCLMNDAQVTRLAEGQVAGEAHARNAYVLMYALDDAGDTILE